MGNPRCRAQERRAAAPRNLLKGARWQRWNGDLAPRRRAGIEAERIGLVSLAVPDDQLLDLETTSLFNLSQK